MSLESWRKEYYPVDADKLTSRDDKVLIEASLLKWIGLQKGNLAEHGLKKNIDCGRLFVGTHRLSGSRNCSLCTKHWDDGCYNCPLENCSYGSIYREVWNNNYNNLTPLIKVLAKVLDKELKS